MDIHELITCMYCKKSIRAYLAYKKTRKYYKHEYMCHFCKCQHAKGAKFNPVTKTWRGNRKEYKYPKRPSYPRDYKRKSDKVNTIKKNISLQKMMEYFED